MIRKERIKELEKISLHVREHVIKMATDGGCFIGASLSCVDILVYLYAHFLNINKELLKRNERDYLFLSKGHDVPALYGTFAELEFIEKSRLENHLKTNDNIYWHPNTAIPGVEFHSGSLGHQLSVGMGVAYDIKMRSANNKVVVVLGDGELNEGSIWEAVLIASAYKLNNLIVVVDRNGFQANIETEKLIPLEPIENKFSAFGWNVLRCDGHDFQSLDSAFTLLLQNNKKPSLIIADTVRGKGLASIEARADRWFCNFSSDEVKQLLNELHHKSVTNLRSETLIVR